MVRTFTLVPLAAAGLLLTAEVALSASAAAQQGGPGIDAGYCLAFDGVDDLVHVVRSVALEPAEITIEMWARLDGPQDWNSRLLRKGEDDAYFITADQDFDQRMQFLVNRQHAIVVQAKDVQPHAAYIGTWHHFVGVYAMDHAEFWVDGVRVSYLTHGLGALTHLPLTDLYIGAGLPVTLQNEYFAGRIDEVRIWDHVRGANDIQHDWNLQVSPMSSGLVAYWRFDEGSGQVAHDSSAYGHDGELGQTAAAEPDDPAWVVSDVPFGVDPGSCLAFDGVDDLVFVPRAASLEPDELTVELWARLDGPQDWNSRLLRKGEVDAYFLTADQDHDQHMQLLVTRGTTQRVTAEDIRPHTDYIGTWHHFVGVYAMDHAEFWVDGAQVSSVTHGLGALTHLPLTDLYIGAGLPVTLQNEYFAGRIDEVRIWGYARSASDIQHDWNAQVSPGSPGLVAYWRFDEGSGQVAHDSSAAANHGQLGLTSAAEASDPTWMVSDVPFGGGTGSIVHYCDSTPNSSGLMARMDIHGSLSVPANDSTLVVEHAPAGHHGMFFYGGERFRIPMADGYLCISPHNPGLFRLFPVVQIDAAGSAQRALDFTSLPTLGRIAPGSTWQFQFWFRDWAAGGTGSNLSDAIEVTFRP